MVTAGEECQLAAKNLSAFADPRQGAITSPFINSAMGIGVFRGEFGVAIVRLKSGEWSAPCAITCKSKDGNGIQPAQDMVLLFMSENSIFSLVGQTSLIFNQTHRFAPGPIFGSALNLDPLVEVYAYIRFNNGTFPFDLTSGFTPAELIAQHMNGWSVAEDPVRHSSWHGSNATWFDVLTNKISVDRSSVGNALYLVLNLASNGPSTNGKNFARIEEWSQSKPTTSSSHSFQSEQAQNAALQQQTQSNSSFDADALYQMQLKAQEQMQARYRVQPVSSNYETMMGDQQNGYASQPQNPLNQLQYQQNQPQYQQNQSQYQQNQSQYQQNQPQYQQYQPQFQQAQPQGLGLQGFNQDPPQMQQYQPGEQNLGIQGQRGPGFSNSGVQNQRYQGHDRSSYQ